jgi:uncharacterized protein
MKIIGRKSEINLLKSLLESEKAELLAVYGRRRVGKTFLIKNVYEENICFEFTGTQNASLENQLFKFFEKIEVHFPKQFANFKQPKTWFEAFKILKNCLQKTKNKPVVFFDELPWIASKRSNFLEELAYWWNDWASNQSIVVVICGSAASWILDKVINNKGGLHNRVTKRINLKPFNLAETKLYLENNGVLWDDYQTIQFYMAVGGVPVYLNEAIQGETATQAINRAFWGENSLLYTEFENLYSSLFNDFQHHVLVIKALAERWQGMSRNEIIKNTKLSDGGGLTQVLNELEASSFIMRVSPLGKKQNDAIFRLCDEYSLFYLKFIDKKNKKSNNEWLSISASNAYKIWCGYAFENLCIKHIEAIKIALGISGINTQVSSYLFKGNETEQGFQIDLLIERADNAINICEMKFTSDDFILTEDYVETLRKRREGFRRISKSKKILFNTIITTFGIKGNLGQVDNVIKMDKLFL